jgi:hypothetical protein
VVWFIVYIQSCLILYTFGVCYSLYSALFNSLYSTIVVLFFILTGVCANPGTGQNPLRWRGRYGNLWGSITTDPMTTATATATVKVEIPADLAYALKNACADSASVWHQHWRDVTDGKRSDLDAASCARLSSKCWELWEILRGQGL